MHFSSHIKDNSLSLPNLLTDLDSFPLRPRLDRFKMDRHNKDRPTKSDNKV